MNEITDVTPKMRIWEVYRKGNHINTVEYDKWMDANRVKAALINERNYPTDIMVSLVR